jgi:hypothetical protein
MIFTWTFLVARWARLVESGDFCDFILFVSVFIDMGLIIALGVHYGR